MNRTRVQQNYSKNFINLVLAVVSIIQGLAFNDLAARFPQIYSFTLVTKDYVLLSHFILCFMLLLRVFQTYVTAALDYEDWRVNFIDVLLIFVVGSIEYFVFSALSTSGFDVLEFHRRLSVLSILAFLGHFAALLRLRKKRVSFTSDREYFAEARLQSVNMAGAVSVQGISIFILLAQAHNNRTYAWLGFSASLIIALNLFYSLGRTFSPEPQLTPLTTSSPSDGAELPQASRKGGFSIRRAERKDVDAITELLMDHFSYVYSTLFDTSLRLTKRIFKALVSLNSGRHASGYRSYYLAVDEEGGGIAGLVLITSFQSKITVELAIAFLGSLFVVVWYLGLAGLIRTLGNLKPVRMATDPIIEFNELHLSYLVVASEYRRRSVGSQLIAFANKEALRKGKQYLSLEVREKNISAQKFFKKQGFGEIARIESEYDSEFEQGFRILMRREVFEDKPELHQYESASVATNSSSSGANPSLALRAQNSGESKIEASKQCPNAVARARALIEAILAASYPELRGSAIQIKLFESKSDYFKARFGVTQFFFGRMRYLVFVNPRVFELGAPEVAVRAILAHELAHVLYFKNGNRLRLLGLLRLASKASTQIFERRADLLAISRGYGEGLKEYRRWLYANIPSGEVAEKLRSYFSPDEIGALMAGASGRPELMTYWLEHVPRSLREIQEKALAKPE